MMTRFQWIPIGENVEWGMIVPYSMSEAELKQLLATLMVFFIQTKPIPGFYDQPSRTMTSNRNFAFYIPESMT